MIADNSTSVETLWNCSTLLTIVMTSSGGKMVRMLMVSEASRCRAATGAPAGRVDEPAQIERRIGRDMPRAARSSTASPAHFSDNRSSSTATGAVPAGAWVLEIDDVLLGIGAGQQARAAVVEQQHDRPGVLEAEQMAPTDAHRARPHAGALRPLRQCRRRGRGLAGRPAEFVRVELDAVIAPGLDHRLQSRIDRQPPPRTTN